MKKSPMSAMMLLIAWTVSALSISMPAGIGVLPHATHPHAISRHTSAWLRCTRLLNKSVSCGHLQNLVPDSPATSTFSGTPERAFYYITDWQGNNIAVFSKDGKPVPEGKL